MPYARYFIVAGMLSLGISLLHVAIIFAAPEAYVFFVITIIYILRGLGVMGDLMNYFQLSNYPFSNIIFSLASLFTGVAYGLGVIKGYPHLSYQIKKP